MLQRGMRRRRGCPFFLCSDIGEQFLPTSRRQRWTLNVSGSSISTRGEIVGKSIEAVCSNKDFDDAEDVRSFSTAQRTCSFHDTSDGRWIF